MVGTRRYPSFESAEAAIYRDIVSTIKNDPALNEIKWYVYDYDNDEDVEDEVPPPGKIPALRISPAEQNRTIYSTDREDNNLELDIEAWIDGNHVEDAWGIRSAIYDALMFHKVTSVYSTPVVMGVAPGAIDQMTRGLMRSTQTVLINYFRQNPIR